MPRGAKLLPAVRCAQRETGPWCHHESEQVKCEHRATEQRALPPQSTLEFRIGGLVSHVGVDTLELPEVAGALVHLPTGHWTAVRHVRGQWWLLDSLSAAPQLLSRAAAHAYLTRHAAAYQVLALGPAAANQA